MRLLYIVDYYKPATIYGGPARSVAALCEAMAACGAQLTVVTTDANGRERMNVPLRKPVPVDGVETIYYPGLGIPLGKTIISSEFALALFEQIPRAELVFIESLWSYAGLATWLCRRAGVPFIIPLRGQLFPWSLGQKAFKKRLYLALVGWRCLRSAAALYCTDPVEASAAAQLVPETPTFVVPNGLDVARWAVLPERGALRKQLGIAPEAPLLLFLGRLHSVKRPELALEAFAASYHHQAHLVYAGYDEERLATGLYTRAAALGCAGRIHFTGLLDEPGVRQALADADLVLLPSVSENFGLAAVEALAAGVPPLVSESVPVGRGIAAYEAGRRLPGEPAAFTAAIDELLANPQLRATMQRNARALAQERFDHLAVARLMLIQCRAIIAEGRPLPDEQATALAGSSAALSLP